MLLLIKLIRVTVWNTETLSRATNVFAIFSSAFIFQSQLLHCAKSVDNPTVWKV